jgi:CHAT domain-containing protein
MRWLLAVIIFACAPAAKADEITDAISAARGQAVECNFAKAIEIEDKALDSAKRIWPPDSLAFLAFYQDLATWNINEAKFDLAEKSARSGLLFLQDHAPERATFVAAFSQNLGVALVGQKRFKDADQYFRSADSLLRGANNETQLTSLLVAQIKSELAQENFPAALAKTHEAAAMLTAEELADANGAIATWIEIADAYRHGLQLVDARKSVERALALIRSRNSSTQLARAMLTLAAIEYEEGKFVEALNTLDKIPANSANGCDPFLSVDIEQRRSNIHIIRREINEANASLFKAASILGTQSLKDDIRFAQILTSLGQTAGISGEYDGAEKYFNQARALFRKAQGDKSLAETMVMVEQAYVMTASPNLSGAILLAEQATTNLRNNLNRTPLDLAYAEAAQARAYRVANRLSESVDLQLSSMAEFEKVRGKNSFDLVPGLITLGEISILQSRYAEAESQLKRAIAIQQVGGWTGALTLGVAHSRLAAVYAARGDRALALSESDRAISSLLYRLNQGEQRNWADAEGERRRSRDIVDQEFALLASPAVMPILDTQIIDRILRAGQLGSSIRTGQAIAQMAQRYGQRNDGLGNLVREKQDLVGKLRSIQTDSLGNMTGNDGYGVEPSVKSADIERRISEIDNIISMTDPKAEILLRSSVTNVSEIQKAIQDDEVVLSFFVLNKITYAVAISRSKAVAYAVGIDRARLEGYVKSIRHALDPSDWSGNVVPDFPYEAAKKLGALLVGPAKEILVSKDKLVLFLDGPLLSIPPSIFITDDAGSMQGAEKQSRKPEWLVRKYALEIVPSLSAFTALRNLSRMDHSSSKFLGVGAPALQGISDAGSRRLISTDDLGTRAGRTQVIRNLPPLPESELELRQIASVFGPANSNLLLGASASETAIRSANLAQYNVIAFATHGLIAGDLKGYGEPALVLTPPVTPTDADDGLLSASEVSQLKLDADWIILSACSTAAGDGRPQAEPLTGLAKAFFYAGARTLMVTNWPVPSIVATNVTSRPIAKFNKLGEHARSLQQAQIDIMDNAASDQSHPIFWASFVVVGAD